MINLIITQKGMYLDLPGLAPFRSPATVNITKCNIPLIIAELNRYGCERYNIVASGVEHINMPRPAPTKDPEINKDEKLNKIEKMLAELLEREPTEAQTIIQQVMASDNPEQILKDDGPADTFIPEISTSDLKLEGSSSIETKKTEVDEESVDALSNLQTGKSKYNK